MGIQTATSTSYCLGLTEVTHSKPWPENDALMWVRYRISDCASEVCLSYKGVGALAGYKASDGIPSAAAPHPPMHDEGYLIRPSALASCVFRQLPDTAFR